MSQLPPPVRAAQPQQADAPFAFKPASKAGRKARLSIQGMSGSGKTWTGLSIAHGLSEGRRFAVIDNRLEVLKSRCPALTRKVIERPNGARDIAGPLLAWLNAAPEPAEQ